MRLETLVHAITPTKGANRRNNDFYWYRRYCEINAELRDVISKSTIKAVKIKLRMKRNA